MKILNKIVETNNGTFADSKFINLTPHPIKLNDGTVYKPSGKIARVSSKYILNSDGFYSVKYGDIDNLSNPEDNVYYIVSGLVKSATNRKDVVAPATGHPDVKRDGQGHIQSVPGFVR